MNDLYRQYLAEGQQVGIRYGIGTPDRIQRGLVGGHLGNRSGSSLDFMEHRGYMPGDDLRRIDWNAFARSDKLSIKLFRDEVNPHVDIIIDCSRSMALEETAKARATLALAAVFAQAASNSNYTFTTWKVGLRCERIANGSDQPMIWEGIEFDGDIGCDEGFRSHLPAFRPKGIRVFLSDLLWLGDPRDTVAVLSEKASSVFVVQMLAAADVECPEVGNIRMYDCETGQMRELYVDAVAQEKYRHNMSQHQYNWNRLCTQMGAAMETVIAEDVVDGWKLDELVMAEMLKII